MKRGLIRLVNKISNKALRDKVSALLEDTTIEIGGVRCEGLPLKDAPGGISRHHSYFGGLVQHILASADIALTLCDVIEGLYHGRVDRDIVLASIITHDLMKPKLYYQKENGTYGTSFLGEMIDHLSLIVSELIRRNFPIEVIHAVAAHHGRISPISPHSIEALVCFLSDYVDAFLNGEVLRAARFLIRDCVGEEEILLTADQAFAIVKAKHRKGCEGVRRELNKIRGRIDMVNSSSSSGASQ